jgi:hypothetical protein
LLGSFSKQYGNLTTWSDYKKIKEIKEIPLFNNNCTVQVRGRLSALSWVWDGRLPCNGIVGESSGRSSKPGAAEHAVLDYLYKTGNAGLITIEEFHRLQFR